MPFKKPRVIKTRAAIWQIREDNGGHTIASRRGYYSFHRYRKIRNLKVSEERFECEACRLDGYVMPYPSELLDVDHIEPIPNNPNLSFEEFLIHSSLDNLQVLCKQHHRQKTHQKGKFALDYPSLTIKK